MLRALLPLACTFVVVGAYAGIWRATFIYDDFPAIVDNPGIASLRDAVDAPPDTPIAGRPLSALSLAVNYRISGLEPWSYHLVNLLLHLGSMWLIAGVVRDAMRGRIAVAPARAGLLAWIVALLWATHPLATEAVVYVSQRTELLATFFLLALLRVSRRANDAERPRAALCWSALAVACCAAGMASKEIMVGAPLIVMLYDRCFLYEGWRPAMARRWPLYLGLASTWLVLILLVAGGSRSATAGFSTGIATWHYLLTQSKVLLSYLRLAFWPVDLSVSHHWPLATSIAEAPWQGLVILALLLTTCVAAVRGRWYGFCGACIFIVLAPSSSIVPIATEVAAERRMYLPLAALAALVVFASRAITSRYPRMSTFALPLVIAIGAGLVALTALRVTDYSSHIRIWDRAVARDPANPVAQHNLGVALIRERQPQRAAGALSASLSVRPGHLGTMTSLALALERLDRVDEATALYEDVLSADPNAGRAHVRLGTIHARAQRNDAAQHHLLAALKINGSDHEAHNALANVYLQTDHPERQQRAEHHYRAAMRAAPWDAGPVRNLALLRARQGRLEEAATLFRRVLEMDPTDEDARFNLERATRMMGNF